MSDPVTPTRRAFLATSASALGGTWLAAALPTLGVLSACARDAARRGDAFTTLTPAQGETMAAFAANIIPTDELPGATDAGVVHFIDLALGTHFAPLRDVITEGLADLDLRAGANEGSRFATLLPEQQIGAMREVENTAFFFNARMLTLMGLLADPKHGGNRDNVGLDLIRREHAGVWQPPFGYYDAQATIAGTGGAS
jgi:gluconate 2-dehydrogenase gamma chain